MYTLRKVPTEEAVGLMFAHDLTRIVPGEGKGPAFRRGQIVRPEDIPVLLAMGTEHLYVWEPQPGMVHEEEAALRLARAGAGGGLRWDPPAEGKVSLKAAFRGLLRVDAARLETINAIGDITIATLRDATLVEPEAIVAGCKVTPLLVPEAQIQRAEAVGRWIEVKPLTPLRAGLVITGSEVYKGRIPDKFGPVVEEKLARFGCPVVYKAYSSDQAELTAAKIHEAVAAGAQMVLCTGGMSVDPDDATPGAIRRAGADVVTYGVPFLPGSMFLFAYLGDVPVMGLPGAVMWEKETVFDHVLPRVLAGERLAKADFVRMGHGGLLPK